MTAWDGDAYQQRFDQLAASGTDVHGEAAFVMRYRPATLLDAGCGTGRVAVEVARRGVEVVGVDLDASMLATARRLGPTVEWHEADLATLIRRVATIEGVERIRFTTSHPAQFDDSLVAAYADVEKLVSHLHLPVQSGSDRILKLMKRGYTSARYIAKIEKLKAVRPGIAIATDLIVGFPGETEEDFQQTLDLVRTVGFDQSFSFIFSARPGTEAAELEGQLPWEVTQPRLARLQARARINQFFERRF